MTPEFSRVVAVDRLPEQLTVEADPTERRALAARLGIPEVLSLLCRFSLQRRGATVHVSGVLAAEVVQSCVVSLDPVQQRVGEAFTVRLVPDGQETEDADPDAPDEVPFDGQRIDLGELAAEQLALALDPYPRRADAALDDAATEAGTNPFAGLAALRPRH